MKQTKPMYLLQNHGVYITCIFKTQLQLKLSFSITSHKIKFLLIYNKIKILSKSQSGLRIMGHIIFTFCFCFIPGYLEFSTESQKNNISLQNENERESFLILYRKIMIPVATFISCIFAIIIVRELRLHYVVTNATATNERTEKKYTNGVYIV